MDFNPLDPNYLPWLIPVPPLISFVLIVLFTGRSKTTSQGIALISVLISWILGWGIYSRVAFGIEDFGAVAYGSTVNWLDLGETTFQMGVSVDPLSAVMLFMVPVAMLMIFIYSIGYMNAYPLDDAHQKRNSRFFAYLSLFAAAMLTLVVADNLLLLFVGWEVMGLCSYLLIGFLFEKKSAYQAAVKAFMTTRIADVLMLIGIGYLYALTGTLNFRDILRNEETLQMLVNTNAPLFGISAAALIGIFLVIGTIGKSSQFPLHIWLPDAMEGPTPVSAMIHAAAMVSAGVYMVIRMFPLLSAGGDAHHGEYTEPMILMGVVGSFTALFAAVLGVGQDDVKRVLAYSTISQLGFMVAALGIGAYVAAAFHLITHAFFKALLFMSSGAVIHAMEHGEHHAHAHHGDDHGHGHAGGEDDITPHGHEPHGHGHDAHTVPDGAYGYLHAFENEPLPDWTPNMIPDGLVLNYVADPNNMRYMGGLINRIPITAICFLIGGLSLAGFPLVTAGFWSKDEILADALLVGTADGHFYWLHVLVFVSLVIAATFTAFYTGRQWLLTFWGKPRSAAAEHATLMSGGVDDHKLSEVRPFERWQKVWDGGEYVEPHLRNMSPIRRFLTVYKDSFPMQLPLVILSFFAITAGFVGIHPDFPILKIFTGSKNYFHDFVGPTLVEHIEAPEFSFAPVLFSFAAALGGLALAWLVYGRQPLVEGQKDPVHNAIGDNLWGALQNRLGLDTVVLRALYIPFEWFGRNVTYRMIDQETLDSLLIEFSNQANNIGETIKRFNYVVIDGIGDGIPRAIGEFGGWFRNIQSGLVQQYMLFVAAAALVLGALLVFLAI